MYTTTFFLRKRRGHVWLITCNKANFQLVLVKPTQEWKTSKYCNKVQHKKLGNFSDQKFAKKSKQYI